MIYDDVLIQHVETDDGAGVRITPRGAEPIDLDAETATDLADTLAKAIANGRDAAGRWFAVEHGGTTVTAVIPLSGAKLLGLDMPLPVADGMRHEIVKIIDRINASAEVRADIDAIEETDEPPQDDD